MNLPERSLRAVSVLGAFLCGLVLVFGAILFVTSHPSSTGPALAGTVLLWAHYGATVFFETIRAGLTACFG